MKMAFYVLPPGGESSPLRRRAAGHQDGQERVGLTYGKMFVKVMQVSSITFLIEENNGIKEIDGIELHDLHTPPLHTLTKGVGSNCAGRLSGSLRA